jgi:hydroxymethylpyrimidine/phosphomethylpyrimidine kinase
MDMIPVALTIAGSDPSGGAGIQADLKTFHQLGVYGTTVLTLVTVQNTKRVQRVEPLSVELVEEQLDAVLDDIPPNAAKTGALGNEEIIAAVARKADGFRFPLVVDPVMISKHGMPLMTERARAALAQRLLPHASLVTPNLHEAGVLSGMSVMDLVTMQEAARRIASLGAKAVLIKGGHLAGDAVDVLFWQGGFRHFSAPRVSTRHTHGTGCTYSAAITAGLATGLALPQAIERAKRFISCAIESAPGLGGGCGPVNHHVVI